MRGREGVAFSSYLAFERIRVFLPAGYFRHSPGTGPSGIWPLLRMGLALPVIVTVREANSDGRGVRRSLRSKRGSCQRLFPLPLDTRQMSIAVKPRPPLEGQHFHVVVIGGGINGVAVARECARAGKRTLLLEQNDFASGVTSRSTRIIHGGLRYLEHGELDLVRESVRERERLLRERSHLVQPIHFLLLVNENSQRSALKVRAGLWLYHRLAGKKSAVGSEMELKRIEHALDAGHR